MNTPISLPTAVHSAIRDLCVVVENNASLKLGSAVPWSKVAALARRLDDGADVVLTPDEIQLSVDLAELVVKAIMSGTRLDATEVLVRICERVVTPITDALGYPGT